MASELDEAGLRSPHDPQRLVVVQGIMDGLRRARQAAEMTDGRPNGRKSQDCDTDVLSLEQLGIPLDRSIVRLVLIIDRIRSLRTDQTRNIWHTLSELAPLLKDLRQLVGDELAPALDRFKGQSIESLDDKREVSRSINALLDDIGLRVKCPKTKRPARLLARTGKGAEEGQFQLEVKGLKTCTFSSKEFPPIELTLADPDKRYDRGKGKAGEHPKKQGRSENRGTEPPGATGRRTVVIR